MNSQFLSPACMLIFLMVMPTKDYVFIRVWSNVETKNCVCELALKAVTTVQSSRPIVPSHHSPAGSNY